MSFSKQQNDRTEEFVKLLSEYSREIHDYIFRLVLDMNEADDIFQEANLVLWREFEHYEPGTNFRAWSYRIALYEVMSWRKRKQRERLVFSERFLTAITETLIENPHAVDERSEALSHCLSKLTAKQKELISFRYDFQWNIETIAEKTRRTVQSVYRSIGYVRQLLQQCVKQQLKQKGKNG